MRFKPRFFAILPILYVDARLRLSCGRFTFWLGLIRFLRGLICIFAVSCGSLPLQNRKELRLETDKWESGIRLLVDLADTIARSPQWKRPRRTWLNVLRKGKSGLDLETGPG